MVSQHGLQVSGGWYPSMPCRSPGPHPRGKLRGLAWGGSPGPHLGGSPGPHWGVYQHALRQTPPSRWLLLRAVCILLECILVTTCKRSLGQYSIFTGVCLSKGGGVLCMVSIPVWLLGPMFLLGGISVSSSSPVFLPGGLCRGGGLCQGDPPV